MPTSNALRNSRQQAAELFSKLLRRTPKPGADAQAEMPRPRSSQPAPEVLLLDPGLAFQPKGWRSAALSRSCSKPGLSAGGRAWAGSRTVVHYPGFSRKTVQGIEKDPKTVEVLYLHCGIITLTDLRRKCISDINNLLEDWAFANPACACHIDGLIDTLNLRLDNEPLQLLTESALWKRSRPATARRELQKALSEKDHVSSEVTEARIDKIQCSFTQEMFSTSDLRTPAKTKVPVPNLPLVLKRLYKKQCRLTNEKLNDMNAEKSEAMFDFWSRCYPISDYHLKALDDIWGRPEHREKAYDNYLRAHKAPGARS